MMKPVINKRRCAAQQAICTVIPACPVEAIVYVEDENEPLGGRIVIDASLCNECGVCAAVCCGNAIEMKDIFLQI